MSDEKPRQSIVDIFPIVEGFDDSEGIFDGTLLRSWLIDELPWSHIIKNRISLIVYVNQINKEDEGTIIRGHCHLPGNIYEDPSVITVFRMPEVLTESDARARMRHYLYHEIAHTVFVRLRQKARKDWIDIINKEKVPVFQVDFDLTPEEDFAETYAHYFQQPKLLKWQHPRRYEFLRLRVFNGREYYDYTGWSSPLYEAGESS